MGERTRVVRSFARTVVQHPQTEEADKQKKTKKGLVVTHWLERRK